MKICRILQKKIFQGWCSRFLGQSHFIWHNCLLGSWLICLQLWAVFIHFVRSGQLSMIVHHFGPLLAFPAILGQFCVFFLFLLLGARLFKHVPIAVLLQALQTARFHLRSPSFRSSSCPNHLDLLPAAQYCPRDQHQPGLQFHRLFHQKKKTGEEMGW